MAPSTEATELRVFEWPEENVEYIIPADAAGGDGGNPASAIVFRRDTREEVAVLRSSELAPQEFARELYKLGHVYWQHSLDRPALLAPEQNNHGHAVLNELSNLGYPNIWNGTTPSGAPISGGGFRTDVATKPEFEGFLMQAIKGRTITINDYRAVEELSTYTKNAKTGKTGAQKGRTDDLVICWGIALYVDNDEPKDVAKTESEEKFVSPDRTSDNPAAVWGFAQHRNWREIEEPRDGSR